MQDLATKCSGVEVLSTVIWKHSSKHASKQYISAVHEYTVCTQLFPTSAALPL